MSTKERLKRKRDSSDTKDSILIILLCVYLSIPILFYLLADSSVIVELSIIVFLYLSSGILLYSYGTWKALMEKIESRKINTDVAKTKLLITLFIIILSLFIIFLTYLILTYIIEVLRDYEPSPNTW